MEEKTETLFAIIRKGNVVQVSMEGSDGLYDVLATIGQHLAYTAVTLPDFEKMLRAVVNMIDEKRDGIEAECRELFAHAPVIQHKDPNERKG